MKINMKKRYKIITIITVMLYFILDLQVVNAAATFGVSAPASVNPNETFTVNYGNGTTGKYACNVSGGQIISQSTWVEGGSGSVTVQAGASGTVSVTIVAVKVTLANYEDVPDNTSITKNIQIKAPVVVKPEITTPIAPSTPSTPNQPTTPTTPTVTPTPEVVVDTRSTENRLAELSIKEGKFNQKFNSDVVKYTAEVWDLEKITIVAKRKDSKATVQGTGVKDLQIGENKFYIVVRAENEKQRTYEIVVTLKQNPTVFLKFGDTEIGVVKDLKDIESFPGFESSVFEYQKEKIEGWYSSQLDLNLLYMINKSNETGYYVYKDEKILYEITPIKVGEEQFYYLREEGLKEREGMVVETITIGKNKLQGYGFSDSNLKNYHIIKLMNQDKEIKEYLYSDIDKTFIVAPNMAPVSMSVYEQMSSDVMDRESTIELLEKKTDDLQSSVDYKIKIIYILLIALSTLAIAIVIFFTVKIIRKKTY